MNKIYTSYFYQIRNFTPNLIPVSTCLSDPKWYKPPKGKEYYIDKRGVICGLRYEPLVVQKYCTYECIGKLSICNLAYNKNYMCELMAEYKTLLDTTVNFNKTIKAFNYCIDLFKNHCNKEPIIVLMVYESIKNPCSERQALQEYFTSHGIKCTELDYPIK